MFTEKLIDKKRKKETRVTMSDITVNLAYIWVSLCSSVPKYRQSALGSPGEKKYWPVREKRKKNVSISIFLADFVLRIRRQTI